MKSNAILNGNALKLIEIIFCRDMCNFLQNQNKNPIPKTTKKKNLSN